MNIKPVPVELVGETLMNISPLYLLGTVASKLPIVVLLDVNQRIGDWLASGGKETDPYIWQQVAYAQKVYATMRGGEKG
ncbi:DUF6877 family protein [Lysinibacillus capsici]|uniref:DUF6877 family protein n=1 Tax=Lysinibacillus capsici TaxID=2115968 RepID=UPI002FDE4ED4